MPSVPQIEFVLADNAQALTGESQDISDAELDITVAGWYRHINIYKDPDNGDFSTVTGYKAKDMGDGTYLLYARNPAANNDTFAISTPNTNFEHIWSSWRGQRWVEVANVDEGFFSFRDAIEFHPEVFSIAAITDRGTYTGFDWIDENTVQLTHEGAGQTLTIKMASGWSAQFSHISNNETTTVSHSLSGGVDQFAWASGAVHLDWLQSTDDDGEVTIYEEGELEEDAERRVHDDTFERVMGLEVQNQEVVISYIAPSSGADAVTTNYSEGTYTVVMTYTADNINTTDVDETIYRVKTTYPNGDVRVDAMNLGEGNWGNPTTQIEAEQLFDERIAFWEGVMVEVNERQTTANELAAIGEAYQEALATDKDIPIRTWDWYLDPANSLHEDNPFRVIEAEGGINTDYADEDGRILQLIDYDLSLRRSGAFKATVSAHFKVKLRLASENWHYFIKNLKGVDTLQFLGTLDAEPVYEQDEIEQADKIKKDMGGIGIPLGVAPIDIITVDLEGTNSGLSIDVDNEHEGFGTFTIVIGGEKVSIENPEDNDNEFYIAIDSITRLAITEDDAGLMPPTTTPEEQCSLDGGTWNTTTNKCELEDKSTWELDSDTVMGLLIGAGLIVGIFILIRFTGGGEE